VKAPPRPFSRLTTLQKARRIVVAIVGVTVLALGIALLVLPGPAFLVIPAGLAILAIEFLWAKRWLRKVKQFVKRNAAKVQGAGPAGNPRSTAANPEPGPGSNLEPASRADSEPASTAGSAASVAADPLSGPTAGTAPTVSCEPVPGQDQSAP
jgi:tellurite resistance protein TerC